MTFEEYWWIGICANPNMARDTLLKQIAESAWNAGAKAEREACAKLAEDKRKERAMSEQEVKEEGEGVVGQSASTGGLGGLHSARLAHKQDNKREIAFARAWAERQENLFLSSLFTVPCSEETAGAFKRWDCGFAIRPLGEPTRRDEVVAATLMQWLGSNVGMSFIERALSEFGMKIVTKTPNLK